MQIVFWLDNRLQICMSNTHVHKEMLISQDLIAFVSFTLYEFEKYFDCSLVFCDILGISYFKVVAGDKILVFLRFLLYLLNLLNTAHLVFGAEFSKN